MNKRKLLKLAKLLETRQEWRPRIQFSFRLWSSDCKPAGCACGLAALSKKFKGLGIGADGDLVYQRGYICVNGFDAVQLCFDLSDEDASYLCSLEGYRESQTFCCGELAVANRIREFVKKGGI